VSYPFGTVNPSCRFAVANACRGAGFVVKEGRSAVAGQHFPIFLSYFSAERIFIQGSDNSQPCHLAG
jgi:hypothetical protein